jgi:hypothetical protein
MQEAGWTYVSKRLAIVMRGCIEMATQVHSRFEKISA